MLHVTHGHYAALSFIVVPYDYLMTAKRNDGEDK